MLAGSGTTKQWPEATLLNSFKLSLQYILPKLWLTRLAGWAQASGQDG